MKPSFAIGLNHKNKFEKGCAEINWEYIAGGFYAKNKRKIDNFFYYFRTDY